jgi:predicted MFS family arabinose efflux permease
MTDQGYRDDAYRWVVLAAGVAAVFAALGLARFGYSAVLPAMQRGLDMSNTQAGIMASANLIGYLVMSAVGGAMASHFGARRVIAMGLLVAGLGMVFTGLSAGLAAAIFWRTMTGLGSGAANVSAMGMWATWFEPRSRGMAAGIAVTGSSFGLMFTGPFVPFIVSGSGADGWRICWFAFGAISCALAIACYLLIRNSPRKVFAPASAGPKTPAAGSLWSHVYRSGPVWHLGLVYVAFGFSYIIYMTFFVKYLVAGHGFTREGAGRLFMLMGVCSLACGLIWGSLSDRIGRKNTLFFIYLVQAAAFVLFAASRSSAGLVASAVLFGITAWSIPAVMAAACGDVLGPKLAPAGLGFITLFFGIGQAVSPSVAGGLADATGSFSSAFFLAAGVAVAGALGAATLRRASGDSGTPAEKVGTAP